MPAAMVRSPAITRFPSPRIVPPLPARNFAEPMPESERFPMSMRSAFTARLPFSPGRRRENLLVVRIKDGETPKIQRSQRCREGCAEHRMGGREGHGRVGGQQSLGRHRHLSGQGDLHVSRFPAEKDISRQGQVMEARSLKRGGRENPPPFSTPGASGRD